MPKKKNLFLKNAWKSVSQIRQKRVEEGRGVCTKKDERKRVERVEKGNWKGKLFRTPKSPSDFKISTHFSYQFFFFTHFFAGKTGKTPAAIHDVLPNFLSDSRRDLLRPFATTVKFLPGKKIFFITTAEFPTELISVPPCSAPLSFPSHLPPHRISPSLLTRESFSS